MSFKIRDSKELPKVKTVTEPETELRPPDGGWGWAVCFAAFMTNFTITGMTSSNGIILLALLDLYNESISKTSLVGSIMSGGTMFGGPLTLVLMACKASHRQVIMLAGIVSSASAIASAFVPNVETLIFTYGALVGLSLAGAYFSANVVLGCYFTTKRALALGIGYSGAGCGAVVLPYLTEKSISFYGIRGTFLLIAGLYLNLNVYGALCRPLKPFVKQMLKIPESRRNSSDEKKSVTNLGFIPEDEIISDTQSEKSIPSSEYIIEEIEEIPIALQVRRLSAFSEKTPSDFGELKSTFADTSMYKNKYFYLLLFAFLFWAGSGVTLRMVMIASVLGVEKMSAGYSILSLMIGIGYIVYPLITGIVYDMTHSFAFVFNLDAAFVSVGIILSFGLVYAQKKGKFYN